jgi:predicted dehydrogenase
MRASAGDRERCYDLTEAFMTRRNLAATAGLLSAASYQNVLGANEKIRVAAIGTGGRCQGLMRTANGVGGIEWVALADVNEVRAAEAKAKIAPTATIYADFRKLLEDKSIDAVIIGSPDHWHVPMLLAALAAGKDVYIEKPLTQNVEEGQTAIDAVKASNRIVQVGYQQRSYPHMIEARRRIQAGEIGQITLVNAYWYQNYQNQAWTNVPVQPSAVNWKAWLGGRTEREFEEVRYKRWRWFWDYGGGTLTDLFSHWVDTIQWVMDDYVPTTAQASGANHFYKEWECPDTLNASFRYPKSLVTYDSTLVQSYEDGGMIYRGTKGTLKLDRGGYTMFLEEDARTQKTNRPTPAAAAKSQRDGTVDHMTNFLECVRSRKQPNSDVVTAVAAANAAHFGNLAYKTGQTIWTGHKPGEWRPLFNGKDLSEFVVDTKSCWSVRSGVILGQHAGLKYNDFLRTREHYDDFELKLKFRLKGGEGNSGIQFRSEPVAASHEVSGYQADIGQKYWGCLYDESRRKRVLAEPPAGALAALDKSGWNEYVIRAQGNFITLHLNGVRTVHYIEQEPGLLRRGFIALQVHSGPAIAVEFRDLMIRTL